MITRALFARRRLWHHLFVAMFVIVTLLPVTYVLCLRRFSPPATAFMLWDRLDAAKNGQRDYRLQYQWRDWRTISPAVKLAVIAAEDQRFFEHHGFDWGAISRVIERDMPKQRLRGASTISQQVAKNLFLWSGRSYFRKVLEAYLTLLLEGILSKQRILEIYLNIAQFGDGVFGVGAASHRLLNTDAGLLTTAEGARLAAVLPNPRRYNAASPSPYLLKRQTNIQRQMGLLMRAGTLPSLRSP